MIQYLKTLWAKLRNLSAVHAKPAPANFHSIRPHPNMTNAEAAFLIGTMSEKELDFLRKMPDKRMNGEPANAYLIRRKLQKQLAK